MRRVVLSVTNDLITEQRVHKISLSLMELGCEVLLIGTLKKNSLPLPQKPYPTHRISVYFQKGKLFYIEFNLKLLWFLLFVKVDILTANDLDTLLPNFIVSKLRKKQLVYDSHEYFTEVPELIYRPFTRRIWLIMEQLIFPKLNKIATTSEWIAEKYKQQYKKNILVIKNYPKRLNNTIIPNQISNILLYQGAVNEGRELHILIESMKFLKHYKLWIIGEGEKLSELKKLSIQLNVNQQITFYGKIPFEELGNYTKQAGLGINLVNPNSESHRHSLPNKLFDYLQYSLPVIATDLPEMKEVISKNQVGLLLSKPTPEALASLVNEIFSNKINYLQLRKNAQNASQNYCWEQQQVLINQLYEP